MAYADAYRQALEEADLPRLRRLWAETSPHLHQPADAEAEATMHLARTQTETLRLRFRAYSHRWLLDRGLPSALPDKLKPRAERLYPRIVETVGISVNISSPMFRGAAPLIQRAMADAVEDIYASDPTPDPVLVSARMAEAKRIEVGRLFAWASVPRI